VPLHLNNAGSVTALWLAAIYEKTTVEKKTAAVAASKVDLLTSGCRYGATLLFDL